LPPNVALGIAFAPGVVGLAHNSSPYISIYDITTSFGSKWSDPGSLPINAGRGIAFAPGVVGLAHFSSPYISIYDITTSFGSKWSNPSSLPPSTGWGIAFQMDSGGGGGAASRLTKYAQNVPHMHGNNRFIRIGR
jgi:hypothetical protein